MIPRKHNRWWIFLAGYWLMSVLPIHAAELVATVTSYNSVELTGDIDYSIDATFENTNHSKGNITAGNEAVLTILNMPANAVVTQVVLSMKSNAKSGAGEVFITLDGNEIGKIEESNFCDWPGRDGYSTTFVPIVFEGNWKTNNECDLSVKISASVNTLSLEKVSISYATTDIDPEPYVVTLSWLDAQGKRNTTQIQEKKAGNGLVLPNCEVMFVGEDWTFVGWSKEKIEEQFTSEPNFMKAGEKFYPQTNLTIYALYRNNPQAEPIPQATTFVSGEYALASKGIDDYFLLTGEVTSKVLAASKVPIEADKNGIYQLTAGYVSVYCRYLLEFEGDSVTIKYLQSGNYIGHNSTTMTNKKTKWAWREAKNHSMELSFGRVEKSTGTEGRVLWLNGAENVFELITLQLGQDYEFLLLFDVSDTPTKVEKMKWTCCPMGKEQAIENILESIKATKYLKNGTIVIERNGAIYDLNGNRL